MRREKQIVSILIALFVITIVLSLVRFNAGNHAVSSRNSDGFDASLVSGKPGIAVLYIYGTISATQMSALSYPSSVDGLISQLKSLEEDSHIKAVVLRINSPGGSSGSSQELYQAIKTFKKHTKKPVVVSIADVGASGAYWVALAADKIYANPSSLIGSIGVIMNSLDFSAFAQKYGFEMNTIKSGEYKDIFSSWRKMSPQEKVLLEALVQNVHQQFIADFVKARGLKPEDAKKIADGRVFTGEQAKALRLIDETGGLQEAIDCATKLAGIKEKPRIIIKTKNPMMQFLEMWGADSQFNWSRVLSKMNELGSVQ